MPSRKDLHSTLAAARRELQKAQIRVAELEAQLIEGQPNHTALEISENAYYHPLDAILAGCQIIGFDWCYRYVNDAAARYERQPKEEFLGHTMMERHTGIEKTPVFVVLQRCMRERSVERIENKVTYPDGSSAWFELHVQPVPEGIFILSLDITERKQTERVLLEREQQFRLFMEHAPAALAMLDNEMRYLLVSRHWLTDYRLSETKVIGRSHYDLFPDLPEHWKKIHQRCLAGAVESSEADLFPRKDGSLDWVRWEIHPWRTLDGTIGGILILSEVITERKRAEENIRKLHRTLDVLSGINQSIVRIRHLPTLFEKACEIAVEKGAFRGAWIGLFNPKTARIDPVAHAGVSDNVLQDLSSTLSTPPFIRTLYTGERLICNNIQNDPLWEFWRKEAFRLGYSAAVVLPLLVAGEIRGVFTLCAGATDFFDGEEMRLIDEMAADISFAIEVAEQDEQRLKAEAAVKRYAQRMEILHQIDRGIINANSIEEIVATALRHIRQLIPCQRANVALLDMSRREGLLFAVDYDGDTRIGQGLRIPIRDDLFDGYDARHVRVVPDLRILQELNPRFKQAVNEGLRSGLNVLLMDRDQPIGTLGIFANTPAYFTTEHEEIIIEVGSQLAIALHQRHLAEKLAQHTATLEQKVVERTADLQAALVRVEAILNNSPDAILLVSSDLTIQRTNSSFNTLFGAEENEYLGQSFLTLLYPDDAHSQNDFLQVAATQQNGRHVEVRAIRKDGTTFDAEITTRHIQDDGLVCNIRDITERKAQERQLRYHAALQENVSDAVIVTDMGLRIQSWNEAAIRTYGWTAAEAIGKVASDFLHIRFPFPLNPEAELKQFNEAGSLQQETIQRRKDGTDIFILGSATRLDDEKGVPVGIIAVNRDITVRKSQERQLRYHASIQESVGDAVIATDIHFRIQSWNRAAETIYGWSAAEALGRSVEEILQTTYESEADHKRILQDFFEHNAWQGEVIQHHRDGRRIYVHAAVNLFKDEMGQPFGVVSVNRDITERKEAQRAIIESEARYRLLAENIADIIMTFSIDRLITYMSPSCEKLLGYLPEEVEGKSHSEFIHPEDYPQVLDRTRRAVAAQENFYTNQFRLRHKAGHYIWYEVRTRIVVSDNTDTVVQFISVLRDISERKQAEEALRESEERFRRAIIDAPFPIMIHADDGEVLHISNAWAEISGYTHAEIPTMNDWVGKAYRETSQIVRPKIDKVYSLTKARRGGEFRIWTKAGEARIWDFISAPLAVMPDGRRMVSSMAMDITERKHAEEMLQTKMAEEHQFQIYLKALHEIVIELTGIDQLDTFYKRAVELGRERLGFERLAMFLYDERDNMAVGTYGTDAQGKLVDERGVRFTPDPNGIMLRSFDRVERFYLKEETTLYNDEVAVGYGWNAAAALWNGAQNLGWFIADNLLHHGPATKPLLDTLGLYALSVGPLLAQKQTQLALKESEALYRLLAENSSDLIMRSTLASECLYMSPAVQTLLGYTPEELIGQQTFSLIHPDDQAIIGEAFTDIERHKLILPHQYRIKHKDGHYIWIETVGKPIFSEASNEIYAVITSSRDITKRRQSEEALRESEEKFRLLLDAAPVATIISDQAGRINLVNVQAEKLLGYERDELIGRMVEILVPDYAHDGHSNSRMTYVAAPRVRPMGLGLALYAKRKDGSEVPVEVELSYIETGNGIMVMSFIIDITERKRIADELEQQRSFLRNVIDVSPNIIFVKDYEGRFVLANPSIAAVYNTTIDALVGKMDADFNPIQQEVNDYLAADRLVITSGKTIFVEEPLTYSTGKVHWLQTTKVPIVSADGKSKYVLGVSTDITERKEAEEALRASEEKYRSLVETMRGGLVVFDTELRVTFVNDRFCELTGYSREEFMAKYPMSFVDAVDIQLVQSHINRRHNAESSSYELPIRHKDGHQIYLLLSGSPLLDEQGKYNGSIVVATDISIQKQAEATLRQALAKEKELSELKTRFVSMASHEFRTPLATILAMVETVSAYRHRLSEEQIEQRFDKIKAQIEHLKNIMEDVLMLARIHARRVEFNPVALHLDALIRSVLDEFECRADVKHRLEYTVSERSREVLLDYKLMRHMINNLVSNAIKYSPEAKVVRIHLEYTASEVILQVSDEGIGIPEADLPYLFEPFHRAANVGTISGTGLGLVITREAVELHSGTITVESQQGVGTTFLIRIPLRVREGE